MEADRRVIERIVQINELRDKAIKRLGDLIPADVKGNRSGIVVSKDGKELDVFASEENGVLQFDDPVDPKRRYVRIDVQECALAAKEEMIPIDEIMVSPVRTGRRADDGYRWRETIGKDEKYTHLRGDLERDILDASTEGLAFILDPDTTLKPAEAPVSTQSTIDPTLTS